MLSFLMTNCLLKHDKGGKLRTFCTNPCFNIADVRTLRGGYNFKDMLFNGYMRCDCPDVLPSNQTPRAKAHENEHLDSRTDEAYYEIILDIS